MQDYKLKPCPFCRRSPDVYQAPNMMILMGMPYFAGEWICLCLHCQMSAVGGKKYSDVVQKWNRRAPGWVSVDKVLPADCRACLIATAEGWAVAGYYGNGAWVLDYDELNIECEAKRWAACGLYGKPLEADHVPLIKRLTRTKRQEKPIDGQMTFLGTEEES